MVKNMGLLHFPHFISEGSSEINNNSFTSILGVMYLDIFFTLLSRKKNSLVIYLQSYY